MRCIFCKTATHDEESREHIIPESLGNSRHVLPRGYVCGPCNNYFARKIEGPLLTHTSFRNLRARFQIPTKKGRVPFLHGVLAGTDIEIGMRRSPEGGFELQPERGRDAAEAYARIFEAGEPSVMTFSYEMNPPEKTMSRLLGKMALEAAAVRVAHKPEYFDRFISERYYDPLRRWVRYGDNLEKWPFSQRCVHPEESYMRHPISGRWVLAGYSHDLFLSKRRETFFAFCLYGHEFVINVGGPSIRGYEEWLRDNGDISPVVERVGLRLQQGLECGAWYLVGDGTIGAGAEFDSKVRHQWPAEGP